MRAVGAIRMHPVQSSSQKVSIDNGSCVAPGWMRCCCGAGGLLQLTGACCAPAPSSRSPASPPSSCVERSVPPTPCRRPRHPRTVGAGIRAGRVRPRCCTACTATPAPRAIETPWLGGHHRWLHPRGRRARRATTYAPRVLGNGCKCSLDCGPAPAALYAAVVLENGREFEP